MSWVPPFNAVEGRGLYSCPFSNFYFLAGRWLGGRRKTQEPACEGAEDQAEAQRLPKMAARKTCGAPQKPPHPSACSAHPKKRPGKSRSPPPKVGQRDSEGQD